MRVRHAPASLPSLLSLPRQGLSCSAVGCANLGPALRPAVLPLMLVLVRESLRRVHHFNLQVRRIHMLPGFAAGRHRQAPRRSLA